MSLPSCCMVSTAMVSLPLFSTNVSALFADAGLAGEGLAGADLLDDLPATDLVDCAATFVAVHRPSAISAETQTPATACVGCACRISVRARNPSSSVKRYFQVIGEH